MPTWGPPAAAVAAHGSTGTDESDPEAVPWRSGARHVVLASSLVGLVADRAGRRRVLVLLVGGGVVPVGAGVPAVRGRAPGGTPAAADD